MGLVDAVPRVGLPRSVEFLTVNRNQISPTKRKDNRKRMRKILHILTLAAVLLAVQATAFSQTQPTFTTLSAAVADERTTRLTVTSATGFVASNQATGLDYGLFVDNEFMRITAVSGTTITVERGQARTNATAHKSGARVFVGQFGSQRQSSTQTGGPFIQSPLYGSCTRTTGTILPLIQVNPTTLGGQALYDCNNGKWIKATLFDDQPQSPLVGPCSVPIGSVAYASFGTNTADVANKRMSTSIYVPVTGIYTGVQFLQGGTATTDNITFGLFDAGGKPIANAGATGVLLATADTFKAVPFTAGSSGNAQTLTIVPGPANYFISLNANGSTAGAIRTVAVSTFKNVLSAGTTSVTFGTFVAFTPPTTFTADLAPIGCFYN